MNMELTSTAFQEGQTISTQYTADGRNVSPPLQWSQVPDKTQSFALICEDPDAPRGTFTHWVLFNLPADSRQLPEGMPHEAALSGGAGQGTNDFRKVGYGGPSPPPGKPHHYFFKLFALDQRMDPPASTTRDKLLSAMKGHILAEGQLMGKYGR